MIRLIVPTAAMEEQVTAFKQSFFDAGERALACARTGIILYKEMPTILPADGHYSSSGSQ